MPTAAAFMALVALLGGAVGSFLNVVVYRLPAGHSIVRPRSYCPHCKTPIRAVHNLPVVGWLLLRGRCAACRAPISPRYPLVELLLAMLALALFHDFAGGPMQPSTLLERDFLLEVLGPFIAYFGFAAALCAVLFIDLEHFVIPNEISLPFIPLGVVASAVFGESVGVGWLDSLWGAAAGAGVLLVVLWGYAWLTGREGLGGGDWKLLAMIGAWLGWAGLPFVVLVGSLLGLTWALLFRRSFAVEELPPDPLEARSATSGAIASGETPKRFRHLAIPFGPFLAVAALLLLLFREEIRGLTRAVLQP
jgi:leader peptidase (prepilin peptidase)/N-methyltransferase